MKLNMLVTLGLCLALSANAYALLSVTDSSNADWVGTPGVLKADADDAASNVAEIEHWGALKQNDGGTDYLYMYFEDANMPIYTDEFGAPGWQGTTVDYIFAAAHVDVDRTCGNLPITWSFLGTNPGGGNVFGYNADSMIGYDSDQGGTELWYPLPGDTTKQIMMGTDAAVEWGQNLEGFNFWGSANLDGIWDEGPAAADSNNKYDYSQGDIGSNYIEYKVSIQKIKDMVAVMPDGVTPKKVWKVAVRLGGNDASSTLTFGSDKSGDASNPGFGSGYSTFIYIAVDTVMADADEDGQVNLADYNKLAFGWGSTGLVSGWEVGEFNADGDVNLADYNILAFNWGSVYSAIPEPVTLTLLSLGGIALLRRRR